jgi:hypothetical protein
MSERGQPERRASILKGLGVCVVRLGLSMFDYRLKLNPCRERRDH